MKVLANILSVVFHPLLMVTYGVALAFASTYLAVYPLQMKLLILSGVFLMTAVVPGIFIALLVKYGNGGDLALTNRRVRAVPALCSFDRGLCLFPAADADAFLARGHPVRDGSRDADGYGY